MQKVFFTTVIVLSVLLGACSESSNNQSSASSNSSLSGMSTTGTAPGSGANAGTGSGTTNPGVNPTDPSLHYIPEDGAISIASKKLDNNETAKIFVDQFNRERTFRGFNVSGSVKLKEFGFKPFRNSTDSQESMRILRDQIGSNMIRFTLAWEGVQPEINKIDEQYLADITKQIKTAIDQKIYILLDYHTDLYSRHIFKKNSQHTGNGAPKWAVSDIYGKDNCPLIVCGFAWSAHTLSNNAVRNAVRGFWYDLWTLDKPLKEIKLNHPKTNKCLSVKNSTLSLVDCGESGSTWTYNKKGELKNAQGQCLDIDIFDSTSLISHSCDGTNYQQFIISKKGQLHTLLNLNKCVQMNEKNKVKVGVCKPETDNQIWQLSDKNNQSIMNQLSYVQSQFVWQMGELMTYLKQNLTAQELNYIVGINPINEPYDGGVKPLTYKQWDNLILWPAYERMRKEMIDHGWKTKQLYAEPLVFWSSIVGLAAPATGGGHLDYKPGDGFVFNSHFYDQARMGVTNLKAIDNGTYFKNIDNIRDEARYLNLAPFVSEFGMWNGDKGYRDSARTNNAVYQALEATNQANNKALNSGKEIKKRSRHLDFYAPVISATQWHWGYYYNNHQEYQNDNPNKLKTKHDAWNDEKFSVIDNYGKDYLLPQKVLERIYPRAVQGDIMHFAYDPKASDNSNKAQHFYSIKGSSFRGGAEFEILKDTPFALLTWRGRRSNAPTELFIPRHFDYSKLVVITDAAIADDLKISSKPNGTVNEILLTKDMSRQGGHNLYIWDDQDKSENSDSYHFALIYTENKTNKGYNKETIQHVVQRYIDQKKNPVFLINKMTDSGYSDD